MFAALVNVSLELAHVTLILSMPSATALTLVGAVGGPVSLMNVTLDAEHNEPLPAASVMLPQYVVEVLPVTVTVIENEPPPVITPLAADAPAQALFVNSLI